MFDSGHNDSEIYAGVKRTSRNLRISYLGIGGKRTLAAGLVVDDRPRIGLAEQARAFGRGEVRGVPDLTRAQSAMACCGLRQRFDDRHFGCGTIRIYGLGDFQPMG